MYVFVPNIPSSIRPSLVLTLLDSFSSLPLTLSTHLNLLLHSPLPHSQHPFHSFSQFIVYSIHYYFFQKETFPAIFWFRRLNNKKMRKKEWEKERREREKRMSGRESLRFQRKWQTLKFRVNLNPLPHFSFRIPPLITPLYSSLFFFLFFSLSPFPSFFRSPFFHLLFTS